MPSLPGPIREFISAATRPSPLALFGALTVTAGLFVASFLLVTPDRIAGDNSGYFLESRGDEYAVLTFDMLTLDQNPPAGPGVFVLGASGMREALTNERDLQRRLVERGIPDAEAVNLTAGGLATWDMITLLDNLPAMATGVVVLPLTPATLSRRPERLNELVENPLLALRSDALDEECRRLDIQPPARHANFFRTHYKFFLPRLDNLMVNLVRGPVRPKRHLVETNRSFTEQELAHSLEVRSRWVSRYPTVRDVNLPPYRRMIERLTGRGFQVLLVEGIINPRMQETVMALPGAEETWALYRKDAEALAALPGVKVLDAPVVCDLAPEDFVDSAHIGDPDARARFTAAIADSVATMLHAAAEGGNP